MKDQVCPALHLCLPLIDDNQIFTMKKMRQLSSRTHLQGGSSDNQAISPVDQTDCIIVGLIGEKFPIQGDIRPHHFPADRA